MNLAAEVSDFLGAAKKARDLVWDPERAYQEEMWKYVKHENDDWNEKRKNRDATIAAGKPPTPATASPQPLVTGASTATPQAGPAALRTTAPPTSPNVPPPLGMQRDPNAMGSFASGGIVGIPGVDDEPVSSLEGIDSWARTQAGLGSSKRGGGGDEAAPSKKTDMSYFLKQMMKNKAGNASPGDMGTPDLTGTGTTYARGGMVANGGGGDPRMAFCPHCHHYIGNRRG